MTESEYTNEQLIDFMYDVMDWRDVVDHPMIYAVIEALKERHAYRAIGTIERFRELTEKAEPKKPSEIDEREEESFYYLAFICPTCKNAVTGQPYRPNYCKHCGQCMNWERKEQRWQS